MKHPPVIKPGYSWEFTWQDEGCSVGMSCTKLYSFYICMYTTEMKCVDFNQTYCVHVNRNQHAQPTLSICDHGIALKTFHMMHVGDISQTISVL